MKITFDGPATELGSPPEQPPRALRGQQLFTAVVERHFGRNHGWRYPGPTWVSDLGARIVAGALGEWLSAVYDRARGAQDGREDPEWHSALDGLGEAVYGLASASTGDDPATAAAREETFAAAVDPEHESFYWRNPRLYGETP